MSHATTQQQRRQHHDACQREVLAAQAWLRRAQAALDAATAQLAAGRLPAAPAVAPCLGEVIREQQALRRFQWREPEAFTRRD